MSKPDRAAIVRWMKQAQDTIFSMDDSILVLVKPPPKVQPIRGLQIFKNGLACELAPKTHRVHMSSERIA